MQKQLYSMMLGLSVIGGMAALPVPAMASVSAAQPQTIKVQGQVVDQDGEALVGATIKVKGGEAAAVTDINGDFLLNISGNSVLVVSYVGFQDREIAVRGRSALGLIELTSDDHVLNQLVVVGYGTQKKADLTGSVAVVDAEQMKKVSNSNISTMLEGKVAGVQITSDGQPGADPTVRIRGIGSFGDTSPLYVVDGVPLTSIRDFSPNDIESVQVLKDASAGAIYGQRSGNGVVIITTKNGKKNQPLKVDYSGYFGVDHISKGVYDVMNASQYSQYLGQACTNSNTPIPSGYSLNSETNQYQFMDNTDTDWFDAVFKNGVRQNHNVNLRGGGANNTYNIGLDYYSQKGTLEGAGPNYQRYTARVNNTMDVKFIKFRTGLTYTHSNQDNMGLSNASEYVQGLYGDVTNVLRGTLLMQPTIKAYDENSWVLDGTVGAASSYNYDAYGYGVYDTNTHGDISASNPLLVNNLLQRNTLVDRFLGTASAEVDLLGMFGVHSKNHSLSYKLNLSYSKTHAKDKTFVSAWIQSNRVYLDKSNETLTKASRDYTDALVENFITYDGHFGKNNLNVVLGKSYEEESTDLLTGWAKNMTEPYMLQLQNSENTYSSSYEYKHILDSYFGRLTYNFDEKYLISGIIRRDGSSRFGKGHKYGTYKSISGGWRLDKESFFHFDPSVVSLLKLRAGYGEVGNDNNLGDYDTQATMSRNNMTYSFGNTAVTGSSVSTYVNESAKAEIRKTTSVGIDLAMFRNRFEFTAEWYKNSACDLLYAVPVPANAGVANTTVVMNAGSMDNSGFEFTATVRNGEHPVKWEINANLSTLKNKVKSLGGIGASQYITGNYATFVGQEVGQFYGYVYEGIARTQEDIDNHVNDEGVQIVQSGANVGDCLYKDLNNDGQINSEDRTVLGSGLAKVNFGLSAHLSYKNLDFSVSTYGALNYHVADDIYNSLNSCYGYGNKDVAMLEANQWSEDGSTYLSSIPRTYAADNSGYGWNDLFSSRKIQNAAYWKIANIELGYNLPDKWFGNVVSGVRIYVSGQNLMTFTKYHGYNVDYAGGTFTPGYNFCSYPTARSFMCGIHFSF